MDTCRPTNMTTFGLPFFSSCVLGSMPLQHSHVQASVCSSDVRLLTSEDPASL